jgi:hypothetical protein
MPSQSFRGDCQANYSAACERFNQLGGRAPKPAPDAWDEPSLSTGVTEWTALGHGRDVDYMVGRRFK